MSRGGWGLGALVLVGGALLLSGVAWAASGPTHDDEPEQPPAPPAPEGPVSAQLGEYFTWDEVIDDGQPIPQEIAAAAQQLVRDVLDPLRRHLGKPLEPTSWWRRPEKNAQIKGASRTSDHLTGRAVDLRPPEGMTSADLARALIRLGLPYDQLIGYGDSRHLHIGYRGSSSRRMLLWYPTHGARSQRWDLGPGVA